MKVSIITPVFNGALVLRDAVESVLAQTCADWEWVIVNDGSTDQTAALLDELNDPRIQVIHQANAGASAARNAALEYASGEYVTFLDADDLLPHQALEFRAAFLDAHQDVDIVNGGIRVTSQGQLLRSYTPDLEEGPLLDRLARLEAGVFFGVPYMMRRKYIGRYRFPVGLRHCEDLLFFLTLSHKIRLRYGAVEEDVYEYRVQPGSAMSELDGLEHGYLEVIRQSRAMFASNPALRRYQSRRIQRILFRSWLRRMKPLRAVKALMKVHSVFRTAA